MTTEDRVANLEQLSGQLVSGQSKIVSRLEALEKSEAPVQAVEGAVGKVGAWLSPIWAWTIGWMLPVVKKAAPYAGTALLVLLLTGQLSIPGCPTPPTPNPVPPKPPTPPTPPAPIPVPGLRVMFLLDETKPMPQAQQDIFTSTDIRKWLDEHCVKVNGTPERRWWDVKAVLDKESKIWQDAFARPHPTMPWLLVSNGISGYEGPLPATIDETNKLLQKYAGGQ